MFAHACTACARRQLIFPGQITGLTNLDDGVIALSFTCWCGGEQTRLTGRRVAESRSAVLAA